MDLSNIKLELYIVVNQEGKFFRSVGYSGYGKSWVDTIDKAKIYGTLGQARSRVTWWYTHYPQYGMPKIVQLTASGTQVIDEVERVNKAKEKKELRKIKNQKWVAEYNLKLAERELRRVQNQIDDLKNKI